MNGPGDAAQDVGARQATTSEGGTGVPEPQQAVSGSPGFEAKALANGKNCLSIKVRSNLALIMQKPSSDAMQCAVQLRRSASLLSRRLRPSLQRVGLSPGKLSVLGQLYRAGSLTPTELAERECVKLQSLTRLLAELEAEGDLARENHPFDGRQTLITLTRQGSSRLREAVQHSDTRVSEVIESNLNEEERALLLRACAMLERIGLALDNHLGSKAAPSGAKARRRSVVRRP
jgi:DNA-binding MarR family transcriptional regulator